MRQGLGAAPHSLLFALAVLATVGPTFASQIPTKVSAQTPVVTATISGIVKDVQGGGIPGVTVAARDLATGAVVTTTTGGSGQYSLSGLSLGTYELKAGLKSFKTLTRNVTLQGNLKLDLTLKVGEDTIEIWVNDTDALDVLYSPSGAAIDTITQTDLARLPFREPTVAAAIGILPSLTPAGQRFSRRQSFTTFMLANWNATGTAFQRPLLALSAIYEITVYPSGPPTTFGGGPGAGVALDHDSGSQFAAGSIFGFTASQPCERRVGGWAGGHIVSNTSFFFVDAERFRGRRLVTPTIAPDLASAVNERLDSTGYAGPRLTSAAIELPTSTDAGSGRVDVNIVSRDRLTAIAGLERQRDRDIRQDFGGFAGSSSRDRRSDSLLVTNRLTATANLVLTSSLQVTRSSIDQTNSVEGAPAITINGVTTLSSPLAQDGKRQLQVAFHQDGSYLRGAHDISFGGDVIRERLDTLVGAAGRGEYVFDGLQSFLDGHYLTFNQSFGTPRVSVGRTTLSGFINDEWHQSRGHFFTLAAGLRYDLQLIDTLHTGQGHFAPRIGLALPMGGEFKERALIRLDAELLSGSTPLSPVASAVASADNTTDRARLRQAATSVSPLEDDAPVFPATLVGATLPPGVVTVDSGLRTPLNRQASAEFRIKVARLTTLSVSYRWSRTSNLLTLINRNAPACAAAGANNACRPDALLGDVFQYSSPGSSAYDELRVSFVQYRYHRGTIRADYVLSRSTSNVGESIDALPLDFSDLSKDWSRTADDHRHRFLTSGTLWPELQGKSALARAVNGFRFSWIAEYRSAPPINIVTGGLTTQRTPARPASGGVTLGRNAGVGRDYVSVDIRLTQALFSQFRTPSHERSLEISIDVLNVFNRRNVLTTNGVFGSGTFPSQPAATFRGPIEIDQGRTIRLGLRLSF